VADRSRPNGGCEKVTLAGKKGLGGANRSLSGLSWINRLTIKAGLRPGLVDSGNGYDRAENSRRRPSAAGQFHAALL